MFNQLRTTKKIEKKIVLAENDVYLHINKRTLIINQDVEDYYLHA